MASSIIEHPLRTAAAVGAVGLLVAAAPLIGISSAVAGSVLAQGFAGYAVFETGKDVVETIKDNSEGRYDEVREDLSNISGDTVDLALSLPFVPKALSTVKNTAKYAPSAGLNTELISDLKSGENIYSAFKKADIKINYETITNQMGIEAKPALEFVDMPKFDNGATYGGAYEPTTGTLQLNKEYLTSSGNLKLSLSSGDSSTVIGHELTHYKEFCEIAKAQGTEGLEATLTEYYKSAIKSGGLQNADYETALDNLSKTGFDKNTVDNMLKGDKSVFNSDLYNQVIEQEGVTAQGSAQAAKVQEYAQGSYRKNYGQS